MDKNDQHYRFYHTVVSSKMFTHGPYIEPLLSRFENRLNQKKRVSTRKLAKEMNISRRSIQRILREDLGCKPYKKTKQPKLTNLQKISELSLLIGC